MQLDLFTMELPPYMVCVFCKKGERSVVQMGVNINGGKPADGGRCEWLPVCLFCVQSEVQKLHNIESQKQIGE